MTTFDLNTAHVLPVDTVKQVARVCATFNAALVNRTGCVEQGDRQHDLSITELPANGIATAHSEDNKPAQAATGDDVNAVAAYAKAHGMRVVFGDAEQAQKYLALVGSGGRLSTVTIPEGVDRPLYSAEVTAA